MVTVKSGWGGKTFTLLTPVLSFYYIGHSTTINDSELTLYSEETTDKDFTEDH